MGPDDVAVRRRPDLLVRTTADRVMLLAPGSDDVVELVGTAEEVWRCFDDEDSISGVVAVLADRYELEVAAVRSDVEALVRELVERGLLLSDA